ncbi:MAG: universal stress protein [Dehalococcoidia bacterium]|nr:universal stress protein [Dehalococcoidia bacterium]
MRVILAIDGSSYSEMGIKMLKALQLPSHTEVTAMTVVPEQTFLGGIKLDMLKGGPKAGKLARKAQEQKAAELMWETVEKLQPASLKIDTQVRWGKPAEQILEAAHDLRAGLILIGAKGFAASPLSPLGDIAQRIMRYAECSVLMVKEEPSDFRRVLLATDGSTYSNEATRFLIDLPLPRSRSQIIFVVTALQSHVAAYLKMQSLDIEANQEILAELQAAEEREAQNLLERTKKELQQKNYEALPMVLRGDPAQEILAAAERFNPDLTVIGAKGLSGIESFLLGGVAQRVAKYTRSSVLMVRPSEK